MSSIESATQTEDQVSAIASEANQSYTNSIVVSVVPAYYTSGTENPSEFRTRVKLQGAPDDEKTLHTDSKGFNAAKALRNIHRFVQAMSAVGPSTIPDSLVSQQAVWNKIIRAGVKQRVDHFNESKADSDLGLTYADAPITEVEGEMKPLSLDRILDEVDGREAVLARIDAQEAGGGSETVTVDTDEVDSGILARLDEEERMLEEQRTRDAASLNTASILSRIDKREEGAKTVARETHGSMYD